MLAPGDRSDTDTCRVCGGYCCWLYRIEDYLPEPPAGAYGGGLGHTDDIYGVIADWESNFEDSGVASSGVVPLFEPRRAFLGSQSEQATYRASLPDGTDVGRCQYCGTEGCLLPRDSRPRVCRSFCCDYLWDAMRAREKAECDGEDG